MLFYIQQVDIDMVSGSHDVILDVATMDDHVRLASFLNDQSELDGAVSSNQASMLRLSYTPSGYHGFKEGSWYDIDLESFVGTSYQRTNPNDSSASFLRANLVGIPSNGNYAQFLTTPRVAKIPRSTMELVVDPNPTGDIELTVVDCGHGNWNEIKTTTDRVIYDVGAGRWFTKAKVRALVAGRKIASETRSISIVISHWDIDHFHALLEFAPAELAKLRVVFAPSQIPDTETYKRVLRLLTQNGVTLAAQQPADRSGTSREIVLKPLWEKGVFTMFRATPGRSRNQTGIVLGVRGKHGIALLTGDHHYDKVLAAASKVPLFFQQPCVLVTPHHGGLAGNPAAADWLAVFPTITTPISCGGNSYGHPMNAVAVELKAMQAGVLPWRTDVDGTWSRLL
jgi:beta-lactamase superfamily II metal-dependent hydrolase